MINFRLCILLLCSFVIAEEYISIELSDSKKELSQEIFKKLNNEHYIKEIDKDNFNERYFEAIIEKLDKEKNKKIMACHAKSHISDISKMVSKKATEVHGGMGFTDLLGLHYWFKRIGVNRQMLGSPEIVREEAAKSQGL